MADFKLDSVDELRNLKLEDAKPASSAASDTAATPAPAPTAGSAPPPAPAPPGPGAAAPEPEPEPPAVQVNPVSQDPRYKKYFTMHKMVRPSTTSPDWLTVQLSLFTCN